MGFRSWTARKAHMAGLSGYVRNEPDGSVLIVIEGEEESIARFIEECRRGPPLARVERIDVEWREYRGEFHNFEIIYEDYELPR